MVQASHPRNEASETKEVGNLPKVTQPSGDSRSRILDSRANMVPQAASGHAQEVADIGFPDEGWNFLGSGNS